MRVSLVIPMYNEAPIIDATLEAVTDYMQSTFGDDCEVIFSDDGSLDDCRSRVDEFAKTHPIIRSVGYEKNRGKGSAVRNGILASKGAVVIFTDCDLAYGLEVLPRALEVFDNDPSAELVIGSRNLTQDGYDGYTPIRKLASKLYIKVLALAAGFKLTDSQCGFKCFRHEAAQKIFSQCEVDGFAFDFEVLIRATKLGMKPVELPVKVINHRESKVHVLRDSLRMLGDISRIKKKIK